MHDAKHSTMIVTPHMYYYNLACWLWPCLKLKAPQQNTHSPPSLLIPLSFHTEPCTHSMMGLGRNHAWIHVAADVPPFFLFGHVRALLLAHWLAQHERIREKLREEKSTVRTR